MEKRKNEEVKKMAKNADESKKKGKIRGITLIALVITIIVLLILVGVSLSTLTGQDGILNKAAKAADQTNKMTAEEAIEVEVLGSYNSKGELDVTDLNKNLIDNLSGIKYNGKALAEGNEISSLPAIVEYDGFSIVISEDEVTAIQASVEVGKEVTKTEKYNYSDGGNVATVPAGFKVSEMEEEKKIENGLVIKDDDGNEFVWIPCTVSQYRNAKNAVMKNKWSSNDQYKDNGNTSGQTSGGTGDGLAWSDDYTQADNDNINKAYADATDVISEITSKWENNQTSVAEESIKKYGGFYIARYEAGDPRDLAEEDRENKKIETNKTGLSTIQSLKPVSKKNVQAWNYITQPNSKIAAENMYKGNSSVGSYLVDSQAWNHICENIYGPNTDKSITDSTNWGNYPNTPDGTKEQIKTGENVKFQNYNIYDMAGNMWEWTTGHNIANNETMFIVHRGRLLHL